MVPKVFFNRNRQENSLRNTKIQKEFIVSLGTMTLYDGLRGLAMSQTSWKIVEALPISQKVTVGWANKGDI